MHNRYQKQYPQVSFEVKIILFIMQMNMLLNITGLKMELRA